jgi:hypothetical protein
MTKVVVRLRRVILIKKDGAKRHINFSHLQRYILDRFRSLFGTYDLKNDIKTEHTTTPNRED